MFSCGLCFPTLFKAVAKVLQGVDGYTKRGPILSNRALVEEPSYSLLWLATCETNDAPLLLGWRVCTLGGCAEWPKRAVSI